MCGIPGVDRHEWLNDPDLAPLQRSFSMADYRIAAQAGVAGRAVVRTVVVQTLASVSETRDLLALAAADELVGAVVGWIDLTDPGCGDVLDELLAAPGGHLLRGVRHLAQDEADPSGSCAQTFCGASGPSRLGDWSSTRWYDLRNCWRPSSSHTACLP